MFIGEVGCGLVLVWRCFALASQQRDDRSLIRRAIALWPGDASHTEGYDQVAQDEGEEVPKPEAEDRLTGWRVCLLWFPAFCDSELLASVSRTLLTTPVCGTTLMNVGLILCPVSIYQM